MGQLRVEVMRLQAKHMAKHEAEAKLEQLTQAALQADEITRKHLTKMSNKMATVTVRQRRRSRSAGDPPNQSYVEEEDTCGSNLHSTRYEIMGNLALRLMQTKFLLKKERRRNQELQKERCASPPDDPPRNDSGGGGEGGGRVEGKEAKEKDGATGEGASTGFVAHLEEASGVDRATGHADAAAADPFFHPFPSNAAPPETAYSTHLELGEHEDAMAAHLASLELLNESLDESLSEQGTQERKVNQESEPSDGRAENGADEQQQQPRPRMLSSEQHAVKTMRIASMIATTAADDTALDSTEAAAVHAANAAVEAAESIEVSGIMLKKVSKRSERERNGKR